MQQPASALHLRLITEVEAWCRECEAGRGEVSVDDVAAVLVLAEAVS